MPDSARLQRWALHQYWAALGHTPQAEADVEPTGVNDQDDEPVAEVSVPQRQPPREPVEGP